MHLWLALVPALLASTQTVWTQKDNRRTNYVQMLALSLTTFVPEKSGHHSHYNISLHICKTEVPLTCDGCKENQGDMNEPGLGTMCVVASDLLESQLCHLLAM